MVENLLKTVAFIVGIMIAHVIWEGAMIHFSGPAYRANEIERCLYNSEWCRVEDPDLHSLLYEQKQ